MKKITTNSEQLLVRPMAWQLFWASLGTARMVARGVVQLCRNTLMAIAPRSEHHCLAASQQEIALVNDTKIILDELEINIVRAILRAEEDER